MENKMDIQVAFNNIVIVVRDFRGTWQQHQDLDKSLTAIQEALNAAAAAAALQTPAALQPDGVPAEIVKELIALRQAAETLNASVTDVQASV